MHRVPADHRALSLQFSRVLGDVGINLDVVLRRRMTNVLAETLDTIGYRVAGVDTDVYIFGSQTEGTTSPQLGSDIDKLHCTNKFNICQELAEWRHSKHNLLLIKDQTCGPGYCRLQRLRSDIPLPLTELPDGADRQYCMMDDKGRILVRNTMSFDSSKKNIPFFRRKDGPASCLIPGQGFMDMDFVLGHPCSSWPNEARAWLMRTRRHWPPAELIQQAEDNGCFMVAKGQKISEFESLEWRISTSLTERTLMFSMNITQIQCYFTLKLIIKTFVTDRIGKYITSYHLKTVVFYCVESTNTAMWREEHLFDCIRHCLQQLRSYLITGHLPNYFIPEDNLLTGRNAPSIKNTIIAIFDNMLNSSGIFLYEIRVDDIGQRLMNVVNALPVVNVVSSYQHCMEIHKQLAMNLYTGVSHTINRILHKATSPLTKFQNFIGALRSLTDHGTPYQQSAAQLLLPTLCSSLGSMIAASDISQGRDLSPDVTTLFQYGVQSDAASSTLKFASILYCRGEFMRAAELLRDVELRMGRSEVQPIGCSYAFPIDSKTLKEQFSTCSFDALESHFRDKFAYCVRFLPTEYHCMPLDLRYEMFRSFGDDRQYRRRWDQWMDWAVVDSLPFLNYLQYLVYGQLGSLDQEQTALQNLSTAIVQEHNLDHRETALNLLGRCLERENRFNEAYTCYTASLNIRARNNAAILHITCLVFKLYLCASFTDPNLRRIFHLNTEDKVSESDNINGTKEGHNIGHRRATIDNVNRNFRMSIKL